jgi:hypothetical protein
VAGGATRAECQEALDNIRHFGGPAASLAGLEVRRLRATECIPVAAEVLDPEKVDKP